MAEIEKLREALRDRNIMAVARGTGIHQNSIYRIMSGQTQPRYETVKRLADYINRGAAI
jgi:DNA-binding phage protein